MEHDIMEKVNCALCGSSDNIPVLTTTGGHFLARCAQCGFQFYSPRPRARWIEAYYHDEAFYEKTNITAVEIVMDILAHRQATPGKLLDVGCGIGALVALARKKGWDAVGIDTSPKAAALAKRELDIDVLQTCLGDAPFDPDTFDVVVLLAVLEHAFDPAALAEQTLRALKPGGLAIFSLPNLDNLSYLLMPNKAEYSWFVKEHINHFTLRTLRALLEKVGFRDLEFYLCGHFTLDGTGDHAQLLPGKGYIRAVRDMLPHILEPRARQIFSKEAGDLSDPEVVEVMRRQAAVWNLEPGEYSITDAVYASALRPT